MSENKMETKTKMEKGLEEAPEMISIIDSSITASLEKKRKEKERSEIESFTLKNFPLVSGVNIVPTTCINFKELVLSLLKRQGWTINDVKFSDNGNLESITIKFSSEFTLGGTNNPWDPR